MIPPYRTIVEPVPSEAEAQARARRRAWISVWVSVVSVGVGYLLFLPLAAHEGLLVLPAMAVPFFRTFILIVSDGRPEAKTERSQAIGLLVIGTFFGAWAIIQGVFAIAGYVDPANTHDGLAIRATLFVMALAALLPIIGLHRAAFRRLRTSPDGPGRAAVP